MPINPINSSTPINFQGRYNEYPKQDYNPEIIDLDEDSFEVVSDKNNNPLQGAIDKAKQNVHVLTVGAGAATTLAALFKGKKVVDILTKTMATVGETVAKTAVETGSKIINHFKKQPLDNTKTLNRIHKYAENMRAPKDSEKITKGIPEFVGKIFGEEKGNKVSEFIKKHGLTNAQGIINTAIAATFGISLGDVTSDKIEKALDEHDIKTAAQELGNLVTL